MRLFEENYFNLVLRYGLPLGIANAMGWLVIIHLYGFSVKGMVGAVLFSFSLVLSVIDGKSYIIPNSLTALLFMMGIGYHFFTQELSVLNRVFGCTTGFAVLMLLAMISRGGIGGGDIKLSAVMGFWLGFPEVLYFLFIAAVAGSVWGFLLMIFRKKGKRDPIPFGPFMALGFLTIFFWQ